MQGCHGSARSELTSLPRWAPVAASTSQAKLTWQQPQRDLQFVPPNHKINRSTMVRPLPLRGSERYGPHSLQHNTDVGYPGLIGATSVDRKSLAGLGAGSRRRNITRGEPHECGRHRQSAGQARRRKSRRQTPDVESVDQKWLRSQPRSTSTRVTSRQAAVTWFGMFAVVGPAGG